MSIYGNVSVEGGFDQAEIDFVTNLISSGQTTPEQVSAQFGVPVDVINSVYQQNLPQAPEPARTDQTLGLINTIQQANTLANAAKDIYSGLTTAAPAAAANVPYQSPYAINLGGSDAAAITDPTATFTGGLSSAVGMLSGKESSSESAGLAVLSAFNPAAALAYRLFDAMGLFGGGGLKETPMTPEEAAKYSSESRLATTLQGAGEGAGELILDAVQQAKAAGVTPEQIAETLNTRGDLASELIGLTVGSNQPFVDVPSAADRAAAEASVDPVGGSTSSLESDGDLTGDLDTIIDSVASGGSTETVSDVNEEWTYNAATDSFISSTRGDSVPNAGNAVLKDGGVYTVTPIIGTDGVAAEHVVDAETNKSVGILNVDINTGIPTITNETTTAVTTEVPVTSADTTGTADTAVVDTSGGVASPTDTAPTITPTPPTTATPSITTTPPTVTTPTNGTDGIDGTDGRDGTNGGDGTDGKDGRDGRDGLTGMLTLNTIATPLADEIFTSEFKMDYLKPEFIGLLDLTRGRTV